MELDWSSAEVHDGTLEVALSGEIPKGWKERFEQTIELLPGGEWGKIKMKKDRVRVHGVAEGGEDRLRHFLESVVLQASVTDEPDDPEAGERGQDAEGEKPDPLDVKMTDRFRSFAAEPRE